MLQGPLRLTMVFQLRAHKLTKRQTAAASTAQHQGSEQEGGAGRVRVFWQCTHSARHSARAGSGVNSTSSVEMAWNQKNIMKPVFSMFWSLGAISCGICSVSSPCTVAVHCACTVRALCVHCKNTHVCPAEAGNIQSVKNLENILCVRDSH